MLGYNPTTDTNAKILKDRERCTAVPIALYSCDWGASGKNSRIWIHGGAISRKELTELNSKSPAIADFSEGVSSFTVSIASSQSVCYIAPTEALASPQMVEIDESKLVNKNSRVHSLLMPLSGQGVDRLIEKDDCLIVKVNLFLKKFVLVSNSDTNIMHCLPMAKFFEMPFMKKGLN